VTAGGRPRRARKVHRVTPFGRGALGGFQLAEVAPAAGVTIGDLARQPLGKTLHMMNSSSPPGQRGMRRHAHRVHEQPDCARSARSCTASPISGRSPRWIDESCHYYFGSVSRWRRQNGLELWEPRTSRTNDQSTGGQSFQRCCKQSPDELRTTHD